MLSRRGFLGTVSAGLLVWRSSAEAQPAGKIPRVGFLTHAVRRGGDRLYAALQQGLAELGWVDGRNVALFYRVAESRDAIARMAAELVQSGLDVVVLSANALPEARAATRRMPVVFAIASDPVKAGFVSSLARPGGNMTGVTSLNIELDGKRLEILKAALPKATRVGVLSTADDPEHGQRIAAAEQAARALDLSAPIIEVTAMNVPAALEAARRAKVDSAMVLGSPRMFPHQARTAELARKAGLPVISAWREFPDAGGLISYGTNLPAMFRRAASYVDRILKGANPADLPVEQASTFELVINVKAAQALGLTIPPSLLLRADQIIE
jgi:putative tryptophan/tyrosine transport system substrate-binding protein